MPPKKRKDHRKPQDDRLNLRIPPDLMHRLKALEAKAASIRELQTVGTIDRSKVAKAALVRGVEALEAEAGIGKAGTGRGR